MWTLAHWPIIHLRYLLPGFIMGPWDVKPPYLSSLADDEQRGVEGDPGYRHQEVGVLVAARLLADGDGSLSYLPVQTVDEPQVSLHPGIVNLRQLLDESLGEGARINRDVVHEQVCVHLVLHLGPLPDKVRPVPDQLPELHGLPRWDVAFRHEPTPQKSGEHERVDFIRLDLCGRDCLVLDGVREDHAVPLRQEPVSPVPGRGGLDGYGRLCGYAL